MSVKYLIPLISLISIVLIAGFIFLVTDAFTNLNTTQAAIIGVLVGSLGGIVASTLSSMTSLWESSRDMEERLKDRVSTHALELTRMDYELRQKSLELKKEKRMFLAPIKVYRELYRALLKLHETGDWPDNIYELGLLNIFELGEEDTMKKESTRAQ